MELTIALAISILSAVMTVANFVVNRKDKAVKDAKEGYQDNYLQNTSCTLLDFRLTQVEKKIDKILDMLDSYEKELDSRVEKAIKNHVLLYHGKEAIK